METKKNDLAFPAVWKTYLLHSLKFLAIFYAATFGILLFFLHRGENWIMLGTMFTIAYITILFFSLRRFIQKLPMAVIFLAAPTIPLLMLVLFISMIPFLQLVNAYFFSTCR